MSNEKKGAGRPANPVLATVRKEDVVMERNVRHRHLWDVEGYDPNDVSLYGDSLQKIWDSVQEQWDNKVLRYTQTPIMYKREDGKYVPQVGNTRTLAWLTYGKDDQEMAVEVRSKEMTEEERLSENTIRTDMTELSIAYTLYGKKGAEYKRAVIATGWGETKCKQWSHIMSTLPKSYWLWIEQKRITIDTAIELCTQDKRLIAFLEGALKGNDVCEKADGDHWMKGVKFLLRNTTGHMDVIQHNSPLVQEPVIMPISDADFAIPYNDGMTTDWYVIDREAYRSWYDERKAALLKRWGLDDIQEGEEYRGGIAYEINRIQYEPYLGKEKAWWYNHTVMVQVKDKAEQQVNKVEKLSQAADKAKAAEYADKQLSKEAQNILEKSRDILTHEELMEMLKVEHSMPKDATLHTLLYCMLSWRGAFLRESTKRMLMPDYDRRYTRLMEQYMDEKQEMLGAEMEALRKKKKASVDIFFAPHVFIPWQTYAADVLAGHCFWVNGEAMKHIKEQCKILGISVSWHDKEKACAMIKRGLDKWTTKWDEDERAMYEHKNKQWSDTKEVMRGYAQHLALWLGENIDDENGNVVCQTSYDAINKAFIDFMRKWYKRDVYLKWMGKPIAQWCGERADGGKQVYDVILVMVSWLMDNKQRVPNYGETPTSPMPEKKVQAVETTTEMEEEEDYDESEFIMDDADDDRDYSMMEDMGD